MTKVAKRQYGRADTNIIIYQKDDLERHIHIFENLVRIQTCPRKSYLPNGKIL